MNDDVQRLVAYCKANLDLSPTELDKNYGYSSLPLCVIDAIFSIRANYTSTRNTVDHFCKYFNVPRGVSKESPPIAELSVATFIKFYSDNSVEFMAREVYQNWQRTPGRSSILKAEAVLRVAETLFEYGINYKSDVNLVTRQPEFESAFKRVRGQRPGTSLRYFYMLAGSKNDIKPDGMVIRFIRKAINRLPTSDDCHQLLVETSSLLAADYPELTPRSLDHKIWLFQRTQP